MLTLLSCGQGQNGVSILTFDFVIKTDNLSTGSSTNTQFALPLVSTGTYNFVVNWGDGTSDTITTWNQAQTIKTYSSIGTYNIKITGTLVGWVFNNAGDRLKLLSINSWGNMRLGTTQGSYFYGCANLVLTGVSDILDLTGTTILSGCFRNCNQISTIARINEWNVSNVTNMFQMFSGASIFNSNISNWNTTNVTNFGNLFAFTAFNQNIGAWNVENGINFNSMFINASVFNQNISNWNTGKATNMREMFKGAIAFNQNIGAWNVSNVTNFVNFMNGKTPATFSTTNLDAIYNGWSSRPVKPNLSITFGTAKYTAGSQAGKNILTGAPNNWTITDGGI